MLTEGGAYAFKRMQVGATATGDGNSMTPLTVNGGSYALLTAQVVGISGDTITWEGTIDEENWIALPALNVATREVSTTVTADGIYRLVVTSLVAVRARISTYSGGTIYIYGLLTAAGEPGFLAEGGVTDHAALDNLDYASAGHTGFEAAGTAAAAIATHVGLADPHTQYALESALGTMAAATEADYLKADGSRTGAASQGQAFTNGTKQNKIILLSDSSATALQVRNAADSASWITFDANNERWLFNAYSGLRVNNAGNATSFEGQLSGTTYFKVYAFAAERRIDFLGANLATATSSSLLSLASGFTQCRIQTAFDVYKEDATTSSVVEVMALTKGSTSTPGTGMGGLLNLRLKSSTQDRPAAYIDWRWVSATDATRTALLSLGAYYTTTQQEGLRVEAASAGVKLAFYGGTPVAKAAAYTQTYSTADRTLSAYTADNESAAYTGIDNAQAGSVYAQLTDLNALRTAYENLRAFVEDIAGMLNSTVDDLQALNLVG